jgi:predicted site-specific integrase-resolvase
MENKKSYRISEFAQMVGVTAKTLRVWHDNGKLIPIVLESGQRRYNDSHYHKIMGIKKELRYTVLYCRESTKAQKSGLIGQEKRLKDFCIARGYEVDKVITEYGSGLNYKRKGLNELIDLILDDKVEKLIVYYKDRLVQFGFELFEAMAKKNGFELIVLDNSESDKTKEQEFAEDLISIIHYFSMKLYGQRSYKKKVKPAIDNLREISSEIS